MITLPLHRRNFKIIEKQCLDLFSIVVISDQNLNQPNSTYSYLLHNIVPIIESLAKDLHQELFERFKEAYPEVKPFEDNEPFDKAALAFLDQTLGLSTKQVKITSELVALSEEAGNRILTPLKRAHDEDSSKHPLWMRAYQAYKHDQANTQNTVPDSKEKRS